MDDNNSCRTCTSWIHTPPNGAPNNGPGNDQQQNNNNNHVPNNFIEVSMHLLSTVGVTWSDGFIRSYVRQRTVHNN
jgi:hypothetical protein